MNQGLEKVHSGLINPTFFERLHAKQGLVKKEFIRLKKIDADKQNQEKLQQRKSKDEYMVFNYLWRRFPLVMATKNQSPILLRQEIGDSEFEKILKVARRYYGSRLVGGVVMMPGSALGVALAGIFNLPALGIISVLSFLCSFPVLGYSLDYYYEPANAAHSNKRRELQSLYQNTQKQNE